MLGVWILSSFRYTAFTYGQCGQWRRCSSIAVSPCNQLRTPPRPKLHWTQSLSFIEVNPAFVNVCGLTMRHACHLWNVLRRAWTRLIDVFGASYMPVTSKRLFCNNLSSGMTSILFKVLMINDDPWEQLIYFHHGSNLSQCPKSEWHYAQPRLGSQL